MFCGKGRVAAAAAGCVSAQKAGLTDAGLVSTAALTFPVMLFVPLAVIGGHRQFSELFAYPVLERRPAQAPAAAPVTVDQLTGRHKDCVPAVADAIPQYPAVRIPLLSYGKDLQFSESSSGQVLIAGLFLLASAGSHPAVFKKTRRCVHGITAVTPANPHGVAVFSLPGRLDGGEFPEPHACEITFSAHIYVRLPTDRFQAHV